MPKVTLLTHTPDPQRIVAAAAKLCYSPATVDTLLDGLDAKASADFVAKLMQLGHQSPLEHASFTFALEGVSRTLLAQITRHRIASFSVQSQRYVAEHDFERVVPPAIMEDPEALALFEEAMQDAGRHYDAITNRLCARYEREMREVGVSDKTARTAAKKRAIEDARFVLPGACDTKMILTMNARSLRNFFTLRCCSRAQWEIRTVAEKMLVLCHRTAPALFADAGPGCVQGRCTEGAMSCGRATEIREYYTKLKGGEDVATGGD